MTELSRKAIEILEFLIRNGKPESVVIYEGKQEEIAREVFGYRSRQSLAQHLKSLREVGYIRTGRGFIEVTQKGLEALGSFKKLSFVLIKVSRVGELEKIIEAIRALGIPAFKVTGDRDIVAITDLSRIVEITSVEGVEDMITLVVIRVSYYLTTRISRK